MSSASGVLYDARYNTITVIFTCAQKLTLIYRTEEKREKTRKRTTHESRYSPEDRIRTIVSGDSSVLEEESLCGDKDL